MDIETIYILADILFTIGGWQLGKTIWRSKGADPDRGKWYGAILGFLLGFIGILTLAGIAWRWHPASELGAAMGGGVARPPDRPRPTRYTTVAVLAVIGGLVLGLTAIGLWSEASRYDRWAEQVPADGTRLTRAVCAEVTLDWAACYVADGRGHSGREWRSRWAQESADLGLAAGVAVLGTIGCGMVAVWAWRRRARAKAALAERDSALAAARLGEVMADVEALR